MNVVVCCFWIGPGCIVKHWSPLLATSKAHQLLFSIVEGVLLPPKVTQLDNALRDSLHLYLQVCSSIPSLGQLELTVGSHWFQTRVHADSLLKWVPFQGLSVVASLSQSRRAYLKKQLHSVICRYLDHFLPASPSMGIIANHPVLLGACEINPTPQGATLRKAVLEVLWYVTQGRGQCRQDVDLATL